MTERINPEDLTFAKVVDSVRKPAGSRFTSEQWNANMSLVQVLFDIGKPKNVLADSVCGPNIPNKYSVGESTVEFMPHWGYYTVDEKGKREHVSVISSENIVADFRNKMTAVQAKETPNDA